MFFFFFYNIFNDFLIFFFFSSRRRHTRLQGDWSSDVCSSDLLVNGEGGAIPEEQRFNNLFDRVDTTATNWLGLTVACAQCHDHKYDPTTQRDYYSLLAAFNNLSESGLAGRQS